MFVMYQQSDMWRCDRCGVAVGAHCNPITGDERRALCYDCAERERDHPLWRRYTRDAVSEAIRYAWMIGARDALMTALDLKNYDMIPGDIQLMMLSRSKSKQMELDGTVQIILDVIEGYRKAAPAAPPGLN